MTTENIDRPSAPPPGNPIAPESALTSESLRGERVRRVAVTTLAEFACRQGDLDSGGVIGPSAREGQAAHQEFQSTSTAEAEVRLLRRVCIDGEFLELSGRVDLYDRDRFLLAEIKTTLVPLQRLPEARRLLHQAQLKLYGWLALAGLEQGDADEPDGQSVRPSAPLLELVYLNLRGGAAEVESLDVDPVALDELAMNALTIWLQWQRGVERRRAALETTAATLAFPHARFRQGQRSMSVAIYRCLRDGGTLLCEAATGTGKTISSLYPAVRTLGEGTRRQVLYLTAKVSGRQSAADALCRLSKEGVSISALTLRSRESACFCERGVIDREADGVCPFTVGFHDRLPAARAALVERGIIDAHTLDAHARQHELCPHALAARLLPWMDIVVGDFNHVFDPLSKLAGVDETTPGTVLLVDEAHNLLERSREMFSASLSRSECLTAAAALEVQLPQAARQARALGHALRLLGRDKDDGTHVIELPGSSLSRAVADTLEALLGAASVEHVQGTAALFERIEDPLPTDAVALLRSLTRFAVIAELYGEEHRSLLEQGDEHSGDVTLRLVCLDASSALSLQCSRFGASVMFSATLTPGSFYRPALGLPDSTPVMSLASPFEPTHAMHCIIPWIDTRYRERESSLAELVQLISRTSDACVGNYLVFLPSYAYLERVYEAFVLARPERETWRQWPGQSHAARADVLTQLDQPGHRVGFAILGGVFGEGIDYVGDRLIGIVVVGTGLPGPGLERDLIIERYRSQGLNGYDFASRYPGYTRVLQTVGRLIRHEQDRGIVLLVDDRFELPFYRQLFPAHWNRKAPRDMNELTRMLDAFWSDASM